MHSGVIKYNNGRTLGKNFLYKNRCQNSVSFTAQLLVQDNKK